jgi:hypothetical protein
MIDKATHQKARETFLRVLGRIPDTYVLVDIEHQHLMAIEKEALVREYPVSTSRFGTGNVEGSFKTPLGVHRIVSKIGLGAPLGRVFRDRLDTGEDWPIGKPGDNLILSRILRLEGLEPGINKGEGIDSFERYIYIHGTNNEHRIGHPMSQGCVCMNNEDVIDLFTIVEEGALVLIY